MLLSAGGLLFKTDSSSMGCDGYLAKSTDQYFQNK
jgi:hypothetical protein